MSSGTKVVPTFRKLDIDWVRQQFPALQQTIDGQPAVFFDAPGGTQVPQRVIDAISSYLSTSNANTHGAFVTSNRTDQTIAEARGAMADFLNCASDEVVFGPNMTTLTFALARAIPRELKSGDELLVTCLYYDANVSPWVGLEERGVKVRTADIKPSDCTLDAFDLAAKIRRSTRLVAVGWAANAVGTINDVNEAVRLAHAVGATAFIDAVHYDCTDRSTCGSWTATSSPAPAINSSVLISAFSTASASNCNACARISCALAPSSCPTAGKPARRTTSVSRDSLLPLIIWLILDAITTPRQTPGEKRSWLLTMSFSSMSESWRND